MSSEPDVGLGVRIRADAERVEAALVDLEREALDTLEMTPEAVVSHLFTDTFVAANTDFPSFEAFLSHTGVESVWDLRRWIDWVLDWHVLGNTRFWSWEWLVHSAVALHADAARVGSVRCGACGRRVDPATGSAIEEPGRTDAAWVEYRCDCGASGRAEIREPDGGVRLDGTVEWDDRPDTLPVVREAREEDGE